VTTVAQSGIQPRVIQESDIGEQGDALVRRGFTAKRITVIETNARGHAVAADLISARPNTDFFSPRHRHATPEVRFVASGTMNYGNESHEAGDCTIIPPGVSYGPLQPGPGDPPNFLQTVWHGPPGCDLLNPDDEATAKQELAQEGTFRDGIYFRESGGRGQDAYEAVYERITGRELVYPEPPVKDKIVIKSSALPWLDRRDGVQIKRLAHMFDRGPVVSLVKLTQGAELPEGNSSWHQARYVFEGAVHWSGQDYESVALMFYPPDEPYPATRALVDETQLLVVQWLGNDAEVGEPASL
jgi:mannose-6-phosphate isomerase-like protein (cupin superfamily)